MDDVVRIYSRWAFLYDTWTWLTEEDSLRAALARAAVRDGEAVLEVAVGTGVLFHQILARNPSGRNTGVDLTEAMLRRAREKARRSGVGHELVQADARALPFADGEFDLVLCNNLLGLVPERDFAPILGEIRRVLRPRGRLVLVTMMRPERGLARLVYQIGAVRLGGWRDVTVEPFVRAAGFEGLSREMVTQRGVPSEILSAIKAA